VVKILFFAELRLRSDILILADNLSGQIAIVTGESDVCAAAKILKGFSTEFQKPSVKIGVLDKAIISKEQIRALADLPASLFSNRSYWGFSSPRCKASLVA